MRLDAEHGKRWRPTLLLTGAILAFVFTAACTKSWVLAPDPGAGGAGGVGATGGTSLPAGSGGFSVPGGTGGFTGDHPGTGGRGSTCNTTTVGSDIPKTNLLFMVGRDASMSTRLGGNGNDTSRMAAVQSALKPLLEANQNAINFGYLGLPSLVACPSGMACCANNSQDGFMPPQAGAAFNITGMLTSCPAGSAPMTGCTSLNDARPVAQALQMLPDIFSGSSPYGDNQVILIIDGPPGCPTDDPTTKCSAERQAVATFHNNTSRMNDIYVIAIGDDAQNDSCLEQIAGASSADPFPVYDTSSLTNTLKGAMALPLAAACTVEVNPNPYGPGQLSLRLSDHNQDLQVPFIDANQHDGWSFLPGSGTRLRINGSYCDMLRASPTLKVSVKGGCPPCVASQPLSSCD